MKITIKKDVSYGLLVVLLLAVIFVAAYTCSLGWNIAIITLKNVLVLMK